MFVYELSGRGFESRCCHGDFVLKPGKKVCHWDFYRIFADTFAKIFLHEMYEKYVGISCLSEAFLHSALLFLLVNCHSSKVRLPKS